MNSVEYASKIPSPPFQILGAELGAWEVSIFFQIHFGIVYTWPIYHSFDERIWFMIIFIFSKRAAFSYKYEFPLLNCHIVFPSSCYHRRIMQMYSNHFDGELWSGQLVLVYQFYFYRSHFIRSGVLRVYLWARSFFR